MTRFRKRPVVIEAIQVAEVRKLYDASTLPKCMVEPYNRKELVFHDSPERVEIKTLEGVMTASGTDWIICGVKGELYPCKSDIFEVTYEPDGFMVCPHCDGCGRVQTGPPLGTCDGPQFGTCPMCNGQGKVPRTIGG